VPRADSSLLNLIVSRCAESFTRRSERGPGAGASKLIDAHSGVHVRVLCVGFGAPSARGVDPKIIEA